jgi:ribokinase
VLKAPRLPEKGETVVGGEFSKSQGGKGANQAVAAARAGTEPVLLIAAVGDDDFGHAALDNLKRERIDLSWVKVVPNCPTGVALIVVDDDGENQIAVASGANGHLAPHDVAAVPDDVFRRAKVLVACLETPLETVAAGLARARHFGLLTVLNPAPASSHVAASAFLSQVDVITPNRGETQVLSGVDASTRSGLLAAARRLQSLGPRACVITLGREGCLLVESKATHVPALAVRAVDATAAGDALTGVLAVGLAEGRPLLEAVRWAVGAAGISVTRLGAQPSLPARREIEAALAGKVW